MFRCLKMCLVTCLIPLLLVGCSHGATPLELSEQQLNERIREQYREPRLLNLQLAWGASAQLYVIGVELDLLGEGAVFYRVEGDFDVEFGGAPMMNPVPFSLEARGTLGLVTEERALYPMQLGVEQFTIETDVADVHLPLQEILGQRVAQALEDLAIYEFTELQLPKPEQVVMLAIDADKLQLLRGDPSAIQPE
ncbi:hypothetical protein MIB92_06925 [Aestuariirhabdus sp. Z084]|uniref:hypothetical protein n=1 Tax=Aestuariirhabdus haliotis TaxID=2918751 RepID=UPI00201B3E35|nr:hypothetical protein [Aestuariirhabdus haliotis]MCL6415378.1 hypothetical protein [Aestuariirhabdus haliotis]MCL6419134.1 hypothetical protein [Aestuariirhabdus haliotis]